MHSLTKAPLLRQSQQKSPEKKPTVSCSFINEQKGVHTAALVAGNWNPSAPLFPYWGPGNSAGLWLNQCVTHFLPEPSLSSRHPNLINRMLILCEHRQKTPYQATAVKQFLMWRPGQNNAAVYVLNWYQTTTFFLFIFMPFATLKVFFSPTLTLPRERTGVFICVVCPPEPRSPLQPSSSLVLPCLRGIFLLLLSSSSLLL